MFLLFGFRTRDRVVSRRLMVCEVCGVNAGQALVKRSTKFTLFFVPIARWKRQQFEVCGVCGTTVAV